VAERAAPAMQGGPAQEQSIGPLTKLVLNFRLLALAITSFSLVSGEGTPSAQFAVLLVLAGVISIVPLLLWERVGHVLMRHPAFLVVDLLLAMTILAITGSSSPFFYFTIGTAMLSGVLYGWRGSLVMAPWLLAGYWAGLDVRSDALEMGWEPSRRSWAYRRSIRWPRQRVPQSDRWCCGGSPPSTPSRNPPR
jgi:hypothetical protein